MPSITHLQQKKIWDKEHKNPYVLKQMDSTKPSSGVILFLSFLKQKGELKKILKGIEPGCGKGRNVIYLGKQEIQMIGIDYSLSAIKEAKRRAKDVKNVSFLLQDATKKWKFYSKTFDFAIDCFATTDIESKKGRTFAVKEMIRVLKPKGYLLVYVMSTDDEFHRQMIKESPADEPNAFIHPTTGKFEKVYDREELLELYSGLRLTEEKRVKKITTFFGKDYSCRNYWMIFQKA